MKKKILVIIAIIVFGLAGAGWYAWHEFNRKPKDLSKVKADEVIDATVLIKTYESNEQASNEKYLDKVIAVKGRVKAVEKNEKGHFAVVLGEESSMSSVRCSMDSAHQSEIATLPSGSYITIKGACTGFNSDELLGSDVILNRCVLQN